MYKTKLKQELYHLVVNDKLEKLDSLSTAKLMQLVATHMDDLTISEQLDMVVEPTPAVELLGMIKAALRGEGVGAFKLVDPRPTITDTILTGCARWAYSDIEDALEDVLEDYSAELSGREW